MSAEQERRTHRVMNALPRVRPTTRERVTCSGQGPRGGPLNQTTSVHWRLSLPARFPRSRLMTRKPAIPADLGTAGRACWRKFLGVYKLSDTELILLHEICKNIDRLSILGAEIAKKRGGSAGWRAVGTGGGGTVAAGGVGGVAKATSTTGRG